MKQGIRGVLGGCNLVGICAMGSGTGEGKGVGWSVGSSNLVGPLTGERRIGVVMIHIHVDSA